MTILLLTPIVLSMLVLAAHFLRGGHFIIVLLLLALVITVSVARKRRVLRIAQVVLVAGSVEWVRTLYELTGVRIAMGEPYKRMIVILGSVALFTALSALLFQTRRLRRRFNA